MTNYNDGLWHGWNGGECPVDPQSEVEWMSLGGGNTVAAGALDWSLSAGQPLVAFRVVKEYREPRELWHLLDHNGEVYNTFQSAAEAEEDARCYPGFTLVHYREVTDTPQHRMNVAAMLQSASTMIPEDE